MSETISDQDGIGEFCAQRADIYRLLASLVDREVSAKTYPALAKLGDAQPAEDADEYEQKCVQGLNTMATCVKDFNESVEDVLACDYARIFLASGRYEGKAAVPYESIYTSEEQILMQEARDQVRALFREAGVMPGAGTTVPEDYLPYEFEFMALLNDRLVEALESGDAERAADLAKRQQAFLNDHLLNWMDDLLEDVDRMAQTEFYHALADTIRGFLGCEKQDVAALCDACALPVAC